MQKTLKGVEGWLLLFCLSMLVFSPAALVFEALQHILQPVVVALDLALAAFCIWTGVLVWRVHRNTMRVLRVFFIMRGVLAVLVFVAAVVQSHSSVIPVAVGGLIGAWAWPAYFAWSKRVAATFGENL